MRKLLFQLLVGPLACLAVASPFAYGQKNEDHFTIAVIPDTQNYIDYSHQRAEGFPFDAQVMFLDQMRYIAENTISEGGDIAFVTSVGDIWQHSSLPIDKGHSLRGFTRMAHPIIDKYFAPTEKTQSIEMPAARAGFEMLAGKVPFSVVPGNHDYDAMWANPVTTMGTGGAPSISLHVGGLDNFTSVFGSDSSFFKDQPWYVAHNDGGADSAQIFSAGGYRFLHIGLQFSPPDSSLAWAKSVIDRYPGLPTIVTTHDYMNKEKERLPEPNIDPHALDPEDNNPQALWDKFISVNEQIFMVLCGHQHGQALRVDDNTSGRKVYQILADYQDRAQTAKEAGLATNRALGIGDGWMRLMEFNMEGENPTVRVRTYSTHYESFSLDKPEYAAWYKEAEKPDMSDQEFLAEDNFVIQLSDFKARFGKGAN